MQNDFWVVSYAFGRNGSKTSPARLQHEERADPHYSPSKDLGEEGHVARVPSLSRGKKASGSLLTDLGLSSSHKFATSLAQQVRIVHPRVNLRSRADVRRHLSPVSKRQVRPCIAHALHLSEAEACIIIQRHSLPPTSISLLSSQSQSHFSRPGDPFLTAHIQTTTARQPTQNTRAATFARTAVLLLLLLILHGLLLRVALGRTVVHAALRGTAVVATALLLLHVGVAVVAALLAAVGLWGVAWGGHLLLEICLCV